MTVLFDFRTMKTRSFPGSAWERTVLEALPPEDDDKSTSQQAETGTRCCSFDVAHFGSVCHWLAFPIAASYWEMQGQWNEALVLEYQYDFPSASE